VLGRAAGIAALRVVDYESPRRGGMMPGVQMPCATVDLRRAGRAAPRLAAALAWWVGVALVVACGGGSRQLLPTGGREPSEVREACNRAELRCSGCHSLDRIVDARNRGHVDWQQQVRRMRLKPASGISVADGDLIVRCLVYIDTPRPGGGVGVVPAAMGTAAMGGAASRCTATSW
jgi:hypothetical protein